MGTISQDAFYAVTLQKYFMHIRVELIWAQSMFPWGREGDTWCRFFLKLIFTPCQAEQPLQGIEIQEKEAHKD